MTFDLKAMMKDRGLKPLHARKPEPVMPVIAVIEKDDKGNKTHYKNNKGYEWWSEYDDKGNETHYKNNEGYECWSEYDDKGNETHYKDSEGYEWWRDDEGNELKNDNGTWEYNGEPLKKRRRSKCQT